MMERDDWIVADVTRWRRQDPLRSLKPKDLSDADWQEVVTATGYRLHPETLLMARSSKRRSESEPSIEAHDLELRTPSAHGVADVINFQIDFLAAALVRRLEEQRCRISPKRSRAALRARKLRPESLVLKIASLMEEIEGLGPAGMIKVQEISEKFRKERSKKRSQPLTKHLRGGSA